MRYLSDHNCLAVIQNSRSSVLSFGRLFLALQDHKLSPKSEIFEEEILRK